MAPKIQVTVLGTGSIGSRHLSVLRDLLGMEPIALPVRPGRAAELEKQGYRVASALSPAAGPELGACIVATSTERHVADVQQALRSGYAVLAEKPLSHDLTGLGELKSLADARRLKVFVGCNLRFHQGLRKFREWLPKLGRVHSVRIECQSYLPEWRPQSDYRQSYSAREGVGGVLLDLIHEIDYAVWLFGRPEKVFAKLQNTGRLGIQSEEAADLWWQSPSGAAVSIRLDYITRRSTRRMRAVGENGTLEWDAVGGCVRWAPNQGQEQVLNISQERDVMYRDQAEAFLRAIRGGDPGVLTSLDEGADGVAVCDAARCSSRSGQEEAVRDWRQG